MREIREALWVDAVWRLPGGYVIVTASAPPEGGAASAINWRCKAEDAPRVGEQVAVRIVALPRDKTPNQVLS